MIPSGFFILFYFYLLISDGLSVTCFDLVQNDFVQNQFLQTATCQEDMVKLNHAIDQWRKPKGFAKYMILRKPKGFVKHMILIQDPNLTLKCYVFP